MTTIEAFADDKENILLRDILEYPDDDGPRERYAEWCEEHSERASVQSRGRFITIQLSLAKLGDDYDSPEARRLSQQESWLLDDYSREWAGQIAEWALNYQFDRGFIELVTMSAPCFLEYAERLFELAPIRHLNLIEAGAVLNRLLDSGHLRNIRSLSMDRCHLTDADLVRVVESHQLTQLRWLSIGENEIGREGVTALADARDLKKLEYVRLFGNPCDPSERYSHDSGRIIERWLPSEGLSLERRSNRYLPWLHLQNPRTIWDVVPNRFRQATRARHEDEFRRSEGYFSTEA